MDALVRVLPFSARSHHRLAHVSTCCYLQAAALRAALAAEEAARMEVAMRADTLAADNARCDPGFGFYPLAF